MGSQSKIKLAYIAGFLDGDGSLMLQLKKRSDSKRAIRFMTTICFYQDTRHEKTLYWIKEVLGIGYISKRNDGMTELRINGYKQIRNILKNLLPYIKFKKLQAHALLQACGILSGTKFQKLTKKQLVKLVNLILLIQSENYITKKKKTKNELYKILNLTP
ncbi:MAG: LAGLIDADG family homing endonuclease [Patescibacteria group bacterium]